MRTRFDARARNRGFFVASRPHVEHITSMDTAAVLESPPQLPPPLPGGLLSVERARAIRALPRRAKTTPLPELSPPVPALDPWITLKLAQVRARVDSVSDALERALAPRQPCANCGQVAHPDALEIERFSRALANLAEVEQTLAGRPKPGSYRPEPTRKRRETGLEL